MPFSVKLPVPRVKVPLFDNAPVTVILPLPWVIVAELVSVPPTVIVGLLVERSIAPPLVFRLPAIESVPPSTVFDAAPLIVRLPYMLGEEFKNESLPL